MSKIEQDLQLKRHLSYLKRKERISAMFTDAIQNTEYGIIDEVPQQPMKVSEIIQDAVKVQQEVRRILRSLGIFDSPEAVEETMNSMDEDQIKFVVENEVTLMSKLRGKYQGKKSQFFIGFLDNFMPESEFTDNLTKDEIIEIIKMTTYTPYTIPYDTLQDLLLNLSNNGMDARQTKQIEKYVQNMQRTNPYIEEYDDVDIDEDEYPFYTMENSELINNLYDGTHMIDTKSSKITASNKAQFVSDIKKEFVSRILKPRRRPGKSREINLSKNPYRAELSKYRSNKQEAIVALGNIKSEEAAGASSSTIPPSTPTKKTPKKPTSTGSRFELLADNEEEAEETTNRRTPQKKTPIRRITQEQRENLGDLQQHFRRLQPPRTREEIITSSKDKSQRRRAGEETASQVGTESINGNGLKQKRKMKIGKGIEKEEKPTLYKQFGNKCIHIQQLKKNILNIKYLNGQPVPKYPIKISEDLRDFIDDVIEEGKINDKLYSKLSSNDQEIFASAASKCGFDKFIKIKTNMDKVELDRFNLLRGSIAAGNDNKDMIKELKNLVIKFLEDGRIKVKDAKDILLNLS